MELKIEIRQLKELIASFEKAPAVVKEEMRLAMRVSLRAIQTRARAEHRFRTHTGNLERSVTTQLVSNWPVVGRIKLDSAITKTTDGGSYGGYMHDGTKPHDIKPRDKRALRWVGKSGFVFAKVVHHPGTKADPFLYEAAENERININAIFDRYTSEAIRKAGLYG